MKMTASHDVVLRSNTSADFDRLFEINGLSVPGVSKETAESLEVILSVGETRVAVDGDDRPLGFINLVKPGTRAYKSANLRWFEVWEAQANLKLHYVDRIAVDPATRGLGLGDKLYQSAFEIAASLDGIGCEVNSRPPNPGSHRFHQRLGFQEVGQQVFDFGKKEVVYYVRRSTNPSDSKSAAPI